MHCKSSGVLFAWVCTLEMINAPWRMIHLSLPVIDPCQSAEPHSGAPCHQPVDAPLITGLMLIISLTSTPPFLASHPSYRQPAVEPSLPCDPDVPKSTKSAPRFGETKVIHHRITPFLYGVTNPPTKPLTTFAGRRNDARNNARLESAWDLQVPRLPARSPSHARGGSLRPEFVALLQPQSRSARKRQRNTGR